MSNTDMLNKKGFTLVELLITIAIIGILASIIFVGLSHAREKAKIAAFKAAVHSLQVEAVSECDSASFDFEQDTGSFGHIPDAIDTDNITIVDEDCDSQGLGTFAVEVLSANLSTPCTATIEETGITGYDTCS